MKIKDTNIVERKRRRITIIRRRNGAKTIILP
jgi:hypothetical protein